MLDNLRRIHERDSQGMLDAVGRQADQLAYELELQGGELGEVRQIVYSAMGDSALPALFLDAQLSLNVPFEVIRGYEVPAYIDKHTLFIAVSYTGDTEETLETLERARQRGAQIAVITAGGTLRDLAEANGYARVLLPQSSPRLSLWRLYHALLQVLERANVLRADFRAQLAQAIPVIGEAASQWSQEKATSANLAKQIALELMGKSVVVYAGPLLYPVAYKWKLNINENAKQVAWASELPEFKYSEFIGWSRQPVEKPYAIVELRSTLEHPRIQKCFETSERLLSGMRPAPYVIDIAGNTPLEQLAWCAVLGDFVSIYLAILNGLDPAPLELVDKLTRALSG